MKCNLYSTTGLSDHNDERGSAILQSVSFSIFDEDHDDEINPVTCQYLSTEILWDLIHNNLTRATYEHWVDENLQTRTPSLHAGGTQPVARFKHSQTHLRWQSALTRPFSSRSSSVLPLFSCRPPCGLILQHFMRKGLSQSSGSTNRRRICGVNRP